MKKSITFLVGLLCSLASVHANEYYWQQHADYKMDIDFDVANHQFSGTQKLVYQNNSPDTLYNVYYHLFFNAFQPGSMMDVRSRTIEDPDPRVQDRIFNLKPFETGFHKIKFLKQDGKNVSFKVVGTILEVTLNKPILPKNKAVFSMGFDSQVPKQIRRSGHSNSEGIDYSMTQWYPKMCEYDRQGWQAHPYIAREFQGVWSNFDVTINMNKKYTIGGTGVLQNPQEIGHGYESQEKKMNLPTGDLLKWHFIAKKVHDFAWAADRDFKHDIVTPESGPELHFFYQTDTLEENWIKLKSYAVKLFAIANDLFGEYPYQQYSIIQGGDGGMEYPMCTLISGHIRLGGLISVTVHEVMHSWFQGMLATNEAKYAWMDEGFTTYAQRLILAQIYNNQSLNPLARNYNSYFDLVAAGKEEPSITHSDHFHTNHAYGVSAYSKGAIFLHQLSYVIGQENLEKGMLRYFHEWKYKHPTPNDFIRVMEKVSGLELDWYLEHWIYTINTIDYGIKEVHADKESTHISIERVGKMPMPIDMLVILNDGTEVLYHIPLRIMRGSKQESYFGDIKVEVREAWPWTYPEYNLVVPFKKESIKAIQIDPSTRMADVNNLNDFYPSISQVKYLGE